MPAHVADARMDVVKLALAIATRVTHQEAAAEPARGGGGEWKSACGRWGRDGRLLHAHPTDVEALEAYLPDLLSSLKSIEEIHLQPDEAAGVGGCFLRFGSGEIDARLETQIARIADELVGGES